VKRTVFTLMIFLILSTVMLSAINDIVTGQKIRVTLKEITPFSYVSVRHQGPLSDFETAVAILMGNMQRQNIAPAGTMFAIMHEIPEEGKEITLDWEVSFPVTAQVYPQPPLTKGFWEHPHVASANHTGPAATLGDAVDEMFIWIEENGYDRAGPVLAVFQNIGEPDTIPSRLQTEIWIAIQKN
jgi:effector-binding domain-containing protein